MSDLKSGLVRLDAGTALYDLRNFRAYWLDNEHPELTEEDWKMAMELLSSTVYECKQLVRQIRGKFVVSETVRVEVQDLDIGMKVLSSTDILEIRTVIGLVLLKDEATLTFDDGEIVTVNPHDAVSVVVGD